MPLRLSAALARTSAYYAALFGALGVHLPFWPLWLADWGLSEGEIGAYSSAGVVMRLILGLGLPMLADRYEARRLTLALTAGAGALLFVAHLGAGTHAALLGLTMLTAGLFSALMPLGDALGAAAAREFRFEYAHARAVGSAAFLGMNIAMGAAIGWIGTDVALWAIVACLVLAAGFGFTHPGGGRVKTGIRPGMDEIRRIVTHRAFVPFILATGLAQGSHGVIYVYGSVRWRTLGVPEETIGLLWAAGVAAEVVVMAVLGPWLMRRLGASGAIGLAGAAGMLRWSAMTLDPTGPWLWVLQSMHALTFAAAHLGAIAFISAAAPARLAGAAQAVMQVMAGGLLMAGSMALASVVYPLFGAGAWWISAAMSAGALALALTGARRWDGKPLIE